MSSAVTSVAGTTVVGAPVVDLRTPMAIGHEPWPAPPGAGAPTVVPVGESSLRHRRLVVLGVIVGLLAVFCADYVGGRLIHDQHQRHLAATIQTSKATTVVGDPVMILQIPSIQLNQVVVDGADSSELRGGPGLVTSGALPGHRGTAVVLGHYYRYAGPFSDLHKVHKGDAVTVQLRDKTVRGYTVARVQKVATDDSRAFAPSKTERLVLATDAGFFSSRRVVVTLKPDAPATVGKAPTVPIRLAGGVSLAALALVIVLIGAAGAALILGTRYLRRRYRLGTVLTCMLPFAGLLLVVTVLCIDLALSATA